jgi:hypothetical protein
MQESGLLRYTTLTFGRDSVCITHVHIIQLYQTKKMVPHPARFDKLGFPVLRKRDIGGSL